jgi:glucose/arabinose dehydrogenase
MLAMVLLAMITAADSGAEPRFRGDVVATRVDSEAATFQVVRVVSGLEHPWALAFLPDDRILITERPGRLWMLDGEQVVAVGGVPPVRAVGQGGLLDIILHPHFAENRIVYLSYAADYRGGAGTRVARAILDSNSLTDLEVIFEMNPPGRGPVHFGS